VAASSGGGPPALASAAGELSDALERSLDEVAGHERRRVLSATAELEGIDPAAMVFASRLARERWFCWEQPDRDFALAGLGSAHEVISRGPGRFADVAAACAETGGLIAGETGKGLPSGAGPVWLGGFAFAPDGGASPTWSSFPPALMVLPEVSVVRDRDTAFLTVNAVLEPGADADGALDTARRRIAGLRAEPLPLLDPHPHGETIIRSVRPPGEYESAVSTATGRIDAGDVEKVVLAREVLVSAPAAPDPAVIFGLMREVFPACFCFCVGTPEGAFMGASPELLVRRSGAGASTVALAGSTRRSSDPAVDDHLGERLLQSAKDRREHEIVAKRIARRLRPLSVWVETEPDPSLVQIANIQHLATPIHAQLAEAHSAVELAGMLHPTPAVGGEPEAAAEAMIGELERMDRGWYAGPVGWMDATEDGEFCVALRSALLRDREAHLYAGAGIVAGSDPAAELAETEIKLEAMLPLLSG
jgi:salicylate biosynthesis isochorismate synthase